MGQLARERSVLVGQFGLGQGGLDGARGVRQRDVQAQAESAGVG